MSISVNTLPKIAQADVGLALVDQWAVGTSESKRAATAAFLAQWESHPWPDGLLSFNSFLSTDGEHVLTYAQWSTSEAYRQFRDTGSGLAVFGLHDFSSIPYRLYRSREKQSSAPEPGCVVIVSVEFERPDVERQKRWVDTVFEALDGGATPAEGGIAGHFHLSEDGTRVLNYAEWRDAESHRRALERYGGAPGSGPKWRNVMDFPGVKARGFKRYHLHRSLVRSGQVLQNA
jgi:hypothetical protein